MYNHYTKNQLQDKPSSLRGNQCTYQFFLPHYILPQDRADNPFSGPGNSPACTQLSSITINITAKTVSGVSEMFG